MALTSWSFSEVGRGRSTIGWNGVSLSSSAPLMAEELMPGLKVAEKKVTSSSRLVVGCMRVSVGVADDICFLSDQPFWITSAPKLV